MDEFVKMDVFFAVTTGAVILITALMAGVLVYLIRFLHTINRIAIEVEEEAESIREDLHDMRKEMSEATSNVLRFVPLLKFFGKTSKRVSSRTKSITSKSAKK